MTTSLNTLHSRLKSLTGSLTTFGGFFSKESDVIPPTQLGRIDGRGFSNAVELADWVEKEKFVNMRAMKVMTPQGLKTPYATYLGDLESVWAVLSKIDNELLKPLAIQLASLANKPATLELPIGFRKSNVKAPLLSIDPEDFVKKLARNFDKSTSSEANFSKVFRSASDVEVVVTRVKGLNEQIDSVSRKRVNRMIETISLSTEEILSAENVAKEVSNELSDVLYITAKWVELFGVYMLQARALHESVVSATDKLQALKDKK